MITRAKAARPGETTRSRAFVYRLASTAAGKTTVWLKTADLNEARSAFEARAKIARDAGSDEKVYLDMFALEEREVWSTRFNWSLPPKPLVVRFTGRRPGKLRILYVPLEIPIWTAARGWTYSASLAYASALRELGHEVTVLNTEAIRYRELLPDGKWDQVWTHVHFRHATDHYYREWLADSAPLRLGLAGESVFYSDEEALASPWYREQSRTFAEWRPFLTHCGFVAPLDAGRARGGGLQTHPWPQAVPRALVRAVQERPPSDRGVFVGAAYPPRDAWIWHPALSGLLARILNPEGRGFNGKFERSHRWLHGWMRLTGGKWAGAALRAYERRLTRLRRYACESFIQAIGQGSCVVNLPSMVKGYSGRVVEGMAAGRPVLSWAPAGESGFEDGREIVHYGDTPEELAEAIRRVQRDPGWANGIARKARELVLERHTVERRAEELVAWTTGVGG